jgi:hypothetical protein
MLHDIQQHKNLKLAVALKKKDLSYYWKINYLVSMEFY